MDFITRLPLSLGYSNIFVITDRLSKNIILAPIDKIEASDVANTLLRSVFAYYSLLRAIVSDRGP